MATYLKRTSKLFDLSLSRASAEVNLRDLICPVCRGILIEPVTLPCTHNLCLRCLKGTFEHNSLSCPLCRVRVGSWLRTATKSETLVNSGLWELIRTRFPKEIAGKQNGDEGDIELDSGFTSKKVILSAAGEIRREYEVQLKIAEEEIRRQRESEILANEALIRKIHAEEQKEKLAQLAKDQLLAKSFAEKHLSKEKSAMRYYTEYEVGNSSENDETSRALKVTTGEKNLTNLQISNQETERRNDRIIENESEGRKYTTKTRAEKTCLKTSNPMQNVVTRKQIGKYGHSNASNFISEPSCSGTQIYGTRSKEELHVPIDILSSKKKIVEVCVTTGDDDERIGSAESAGSHDSINQEIHHFKPIKPIPRTALKISPDGRPIDPKLVRVIPIVKRVSNPNPKAPTPTHLKRVFGCSWSAFRGKARQNLEMRRTSSSKSETESDVKLSSITQTSGKTPKGQLSETAKRLDPEISFDTNKNYAKGVNKMLNGARLSKKSSLDESVERTIFPGGEKIVKVETRKRNYLSDKKRESIEEESPSRSCSPIGDENSFEKMENSDETMVNIAERIKKRKTVDSADKLPTARKITDSADKLPTARPKNMAQRKTRKSSQCNDKNDNVENQRSKMGEKYVKLSSTRMIRRRNECVTSEKVDSSIDLSLDSAIEKTGTRNKRKVKASIKRKIFTKIRKNDSRENEEREEISEAETSCETSLGKSLDEKDRNIDEEIIEEQQRMERLIMQEKKDFELAMRLQSQFDDMEKIANRTRGSRRAMENLSIDDLVKNDGFGENSDKRGERKQRRRHQKHAVK